MRSNLDSVERRQLVIFLAAVYGLTFAMGIFLALGFYGGLGLSALPAAQMLYPAAGVMLAMKLTRRENLPTNFYAGYAILTSAITACALLSMINPFFVGLPSKLLFYGSVILWILLLTEKREKRLAYGLKSRRWGSTALIALLFIALLLAKKFAAGYLYGGMDALLDNLRQSEAWALAVALTASFLLEFPLFFGEEYGWRYFLQPLLQKKLGPVAGVLAVGLMWGLWHLPLNFFYYSTPDFGFISLVQQVITCVTLGIFFGWAYAKTDSIWTVTILHYINNGLLFILSAADSGINQQANWRDTLFLLIANTLLFAGFILARCYKSSRLPTPNERATLSGGEESA